MFDLVTQFRTAKRLVSLCKCMTNSDTKIVPHARRIVLMTYASDMLNEKAHHLFVVYNLNEDFPICISYRAALSILDKS